MSARLLRARLDRIERLLGVVLLEGLPPSTAEAIERAWIESRYTWPEDDPLRIAMLAKHEHAFTSECSALACELAREAPSV